MDLKSYFSTAEGKSNGIPYKVIYHYLDRGLIQDPLREEDLIFLRHVKSIWHDRATIGAMIKHFEDWDRELLMATWDLSELQTRIFGYGLHGIYEQKDGKNGEKKLVPATPARVNIELLRCGYPSQNNNKLKGLLARAKRFLKKISRRHNALVCPSCAASLKLEMSIKKGAKKPEWRLEKKS